LTEIMVVGEQRGDMLKDATLENISLARTLAGKGGTVTVLLLGQGLRSSVEVLLKADADELLVAEDEKLRDYSYDAYKFAVGSVAAKREPDVIVAPYTSLGMDLYPGLSAALDLPLISDCVGAERSGGAIAAKRQLYGGKLEAVYRAEGRCILTVRPGSFKPCGNGSPARTDLRLDMTGVQPRTRVLGYETPPREDVEIEKAKIIISVGRGIEKKENLPVFEELVREIDGAVLAGSRPVIDSGWLPKGRQVGVSGKTVRPKLYIAFGISGAIQHLSGMSGSDFIVAVNKDRDAPIFNVANVGIVDDIFKVAPAIIREIKK
jgi:electron transfer flavoprotein alpha subunit